MRPTIPQLRAWQLDQIVAEANSTSDRALTLDDTADGLLRDTDDVTRGWVGGSGAAAYDEAVTDATLIRAYATALFEVAGELRATAGTLSGYRDAILREVDTAIGGGFLVDDRGGVQPGPRAAVRPDAASAAAHVAAAIDRGLSELDVADGRTAAALDRIRDDLEQLAGRAAALTAPYSIETIGAVCVALPDDPAALNALWQTMTDEEKAAAYASDPFLGNRDGLPAEDRDRYNRITLERLVHDARDSLTDAQHAPMPPGSPNPNPRLEWERMQQDARTQLTRYEGLQSLLGRTGVDQAGDPLPNRMLLGLDGQGHAAVSVGNPDTAANVATFVPGTGEDLSSIDSGVTRADAMYAAADLDRTRTTAVIAWYGYDTPPVIPAAALDRYAEGAAHPLGRFQEGLRAAHEGPPSHNTVIGHSYGSTAVAAAAQNGNVLDADAMVFVGSPGVNARSVQELSLAGVPPEQMGDHVYATTARYDVIAYARDTTHGPSPTSDSFGATVFESAPGSTGWRAHTGAAHSEYWDRNTVSLEGMGRITRGQP